MCRSGQHSATSLCRPPQLSLTVEANRCWVCVHVPGGALVNAGLEVFVRTAAGELPRGLRLNIVSPGWRMTGRTLGATRVGTEQDPECISPSFTATPAT